jgi:DNA repair exonuclease SbcCD nuclease subunit
MKVALLTDTHFGVRNDNQTFMDYQFKFYEEEFFPYLKEHGIKTILHCGDLMDRRKYVNYNTLDMMKKKFIRPMIDMGITMYTIVGNHDTYYKNTTEVNSVEQLFDSMSEINPIVAIKRPQSLSLYDYDGKGAQATVDMIPWINQDNEVEIMDFISKTKNQICFGHFDLAGFEMSKGVKSMYHSRSTDFLDGYNKVFSGHFHTKSDNGHIYYLGNPYELTWSDYSDNRGFHIYDTDTTEIEQIVNPHEMHIKLYYDDIEDKDGFKTEFAKYDFSAKIVKLIVVGKQDFEYFNTIVEILDRDTETLSIIEDYGLISNEQMNINTEDTITTLHKYVDEMGIDNEVAVKKILNEVYTEALSL